MKHIQENDHKNRFNIDPNNIDPGKIHVFRIPSWV